MSWENVEHYAGNSGENNAGSNAGNDTGDSVGTHPGNNAGSNSRDKVETLNKVFLRSRLLIQGRI